MKQRGVATEVRTGYSQNSWKEEQASSPCFKCDDDDGGAIVDSNLLRFE